MNRTLDGTSSLCTLMRVGRIVDAADESLVHWFLSEPGEAGGEAFAELMRRHGPMVLSTCRGLTRNSHDAEDAFQATFLVLTRDAAAIRDRHRIGPWLHGVAVRVARRARRRASRRSARDLETVRDELAAREPSTGDGVAEAIHEELARLPATLRLPIVLCCLESVSYQAAASQLGVSEPTLRGRLYRGRQRLAARLRARGLDGVAVACLLEDDWPVPARMEHHLASQTTDLVRRWRRGEEACLGGGSTGILQLTTGVGLMSLQAAKWALAGLLVAAACATVVVAQQGKPNEATSAKNSSGPPPASGTRKVADPGEVDRRIRAHLAKKVDLRLNDLVPLEELLKAIKKATTSGDDPGLPFYVNPMGLQEADITLEAMVPTHGQGSGSTLGDRLSFALRTVGLGYEVRDGFVLIDSRQSVIESRLTRVEERLDRILELLEAKPR